MASQSATATVPATSTPSASSSSLTLQPATLADIPSLAELYWSSFSDPFHNALMIRTPATDQWWHDAHRIGITQDPTLRTLKVVEMTSAPPPEESEPGKSAAEDQEQGSQQIVGFARWVLPQEDGNLERPWPERTDGFDEEIADAFFGGMKKAREELMGTRPHYFLELICVHPSHRRRGIGAQLTRWGCERADADGLPAYVDSTPLGLPLYKAFGFCTRKTTAMPSEGRTFGEHEVEHMIREGMRREEDR